MKLYIKYMVSLRCKALVKEELAKLGLHFVIVDLGMIEILEDITAEQRAQLKANLLKSGLELNDHDCVIVAYYPLSSSKSLWLSPPRL